MHFEIALGDVLRALMENTVKMHVPLAINVSKAYPSLLHVHLALIPATLSVSNVQRLTTAPITTNLLLRWAKGTLRKQDPSLASPVLQACHVKQMELNSHLSVSTASTTMEMSV